MFHSRLHLILCCGTEAGSYLRLIDSCITQLKAQGPSRTCNQSKEEEEEHLVLPSTQRAAKAFSVAGPPSTG